MGFLGVEGVIERHVNINIGSSSIAEIDSKLKIGRDGKMVGYGGSFGANVESEVKAYILSEILDGNGINRYREMGIYVKTEAAYMLAVLLAMPECALENVGKYLLGLFGISATLNNCIP